MIDLRSDTVTLPTPAMREAMARAEVGDDVFGEDPTVRRLEEAAAARIGKEAALFTASGTMANLVALLTHCGRGDEAIMGMLSHTFQYEVGGSAALGGIHPRTVPNQPDGTLALPDLEGAFRDANDDHCPRTRLVCVENTQNKCGGTVLTPAYMGDVTALVRPRGIALHLDGARIFNAAIALGVDVQALTADADTVTFCLSKGLAAPVGSLLCGPEAFIGRARRLRKMVGGGMRQAGVIAAAGLVALETMVGRLAEDHANAKRLADGIAALPGCAVPVPVRTNIVMFTVEPAVSSPATFVGRLGREGVGMLELGGGLIRAVTHHGITAAEIDRAIHAIRRVLSA